ncbi:MAG: ribonuclease P protein component [Lacunisphaera sp.]|nr:ribonuclease P protein component [Lacunisphaera sp.]
MNLRAGQRLRRNDDFRAVREQGRRLDCGAFLLTWRTRPAESTATPARVGVVASRAAVGDAVHRNRAKRRLREIYRKHQALVPPGLDLVLTARAALLRLEFPEVEQRFAQACRKLTPLKND